MHIEKEIGTGSQYIYAYHFPSEYVHNGEYPIKIGHALKSPLKRIKEQQASMKEQPVVDLLIRCDNARYLEKVIHNRLQLSKLISFGNEWFRTTPEVILDTWWTIQDTRNLSISEQLRFFRTTQKMTQTDLADAAGTRQEVISKAETNPDTMSFQTIDNIAKELGLRIVLTPN